MNPANVASLLIDELKTVGVVYRGTGTKCYTFKTLEDFEVGDFAIVMNTRNEPEVVRIKELHDVPQIDLSAPYAYKWLVSKVNLEAYEQQLKKDNELTDHIRKMQQERCRDQAREALQNALNLDDLEMTKLTDKVNQQIEDAE